MDEHGAFVNMRLCSICRHIEEDSQADDMTRLLREDEEAEEAAGWPNGDE